MMLWKWLYITAGSAISSQAGSVELGEGSTKRRLAQWLLKYLSDDPCGPLPFPDKMCMKTMLFLARINAIFEQLPPFLPDRNNSSSRFEFCIKGTIKLIDSAVTIGLVRGRARVSDTRQSNIVRQVCFHAPYTMTILC